MKVEVSRKYKFRVPRELYEKFKDELPEPDFIDEYEAVFMVKPGTERWRKMAEVYNKHKLFYFLLPIELIEDMIRGYPS